MGRKWANPESSLAPLVGRAQGVCTEAGMFALRERRIHVTQEDFEMAVAKARARERATTVRLALSTNQCRGCHIGLVNHR